MQYGFYSTADMGLEYFCISPNPARIVTTRGEGGAGKKGGEFWKASTRTAKQEKDKLNYLFTHRLTSQKVSSHRAR